MFYFDLSLSIKKVGLNHLIYDSPWTLLFEVGFMRLTNNKPKEVVLIGPLVH